MKHSWRRALAFFALCFAAEAAGAENVEKLNVEGLGRLPAFSHAAVAGDLIFVSGTLGTKEGGFELAEGVAAQTEQTLKNIEKILAGAGATLRDVAKVNVFITDMSKFGEMNEVYLKFFGGSPPARTTVGANALALGALVEIECVARKPKAVAEAAPQSGEARTETTAGARQAEAIRRWRAAAIAAGGAKSGKAREAGGGE